MIRALGNSPRNGNQNVRAVGAGKAQVHQRHIGTMPAKFGDCLDRIGRHTRLCVRAVYLIVSPMDRAISLSANERPPDSNQQPSG
jgi:hypothetical protein